MITRRRRLYRFHHLPVEQQMYDPSIRALFNPKTAQLSCAHELPEAVSAGARGSSGEPNINFVGKIRGCT